MSSISAISRFSRPAKKRSLTISALVGPPREPIQSLVDMEQPLRVMFDGKIDSVERDALLPAAVANLQFAAGIIDENAAHALRRGTEKWLAILPNLVRRPHQAQPGLMNERGGLQRVASGFTCHPIRRQLP